MHEAESLRSEKSTNVRFVPAAATAFGVGLRAIGARSPNLAALVAEHLMFRTRRREARRSEREVLAHAERLRIDRLPRRIAAWTWGAGPVVVLVHGWNGHAAQLAALVDPLVEAGFRVVAFDAPAHGNSEGTQASLFDFADALDAVIDQVRPPFGPVEAIVAHSLGGAATTYAMNRCARSDGAGLERGLRDTNLPAKRFVFVAPPVDIRDFIRGFTARMELGRDVEAALRRRIEARFGVTLDELYAPTLARTLRAPLLVLHDASDREVPLERGQRLADAWPGARLEVTVGLGHVRILRDRAVIERIVDFVTHGTAPAFAAPHPFESA